MEDVRNTAENVVNEQLNLLSKRVDKMKTVINSERSHKAMNEKFKNMKNENLALKSQMNGIIGMNHHVQNENAMLKIEYESMKNEINHYRQMLLNNGHLQFPH